MDLVLIELLLWGGLVFFFWALKDGLGHVESDIESLGLLNNARRAAQPHPGMRFVHPDNLSEPIGSYQGTQIHRYAIIDGRKYQFDRVCPAQSGMKLDMDECCVAPGLVYRECEV